MIRLTDVQKEYDNGTLALRGISLTIKDGEFVFLVGPSGSGKSTIIKLLTGEVMPTKGRIMINGFSMTNIAERQIPLLRRSIGVIFQDFRLIEKKTVYENLSFAMRAVGAKAREIKKRIPYVLELVGLDGKMDCYPAELSGGEQQRVAIARALVNEPQVLLLDEPLGALDLKLRKEMQIELKRMQQRLGITFIYVTHDQEEALTMSDTIVVMKDGVIQQIGTPTDIYNEPKNPFVADFIGESNILPGIMPEDYHVQLNGVTYTCVDKGFGRNAEVDAVVRPEDIDITAAEGARVTGKVVSVVFMGVHYEVDVDCGGYEWVIQTTDFVKVGETVGISIPPDAIHVMKKTRQMNLFDGIAHPEENEVEIEGVRFPCKAAQSFEARSDVLVSIRPADVRLTTPQDAALTGFVRASMFLGTHYEVYVQCEENEWIARADDYMEEGEEVGIAVPDDCIRLSLKQ